MRPYPRPDYRDLLPELLDRAREILKADTAAVLLLEYSSGQLIATAAAGLEEQVSQGVRIPVGQGFAGRIAAGGGSMASASWIEARSRGQPAVRALTVRQPWAWAIIYGGKDLENRRWRTSYRGPLIHASKNANPDPEASARLLWTMADPEAFGQPRAQHGGHGKRSSASCS